MKTFNVVFLFFLMTIFTGCEKDDHGFRSTGIILGPDYGYCMCCGGYIIEIEDSTYRFEKLPSSSGIDLARSEFPLAVDLDWQHDRTCGEIHYIKIERIALKND